MIKSQPFLLLLLRGNFRHCLTTIPLLYRYCR